MPSSRSSFRWKAEKAPASAVGMPATSRGWKGRTGPGQTAPPGPVVMLRKRSDFCGERMWFQGMNSASTG